MELINSNFSFIGYCFKIDRISQLVYVLPIAHSSIDFQKSLLLKYRETNDFF